MYRPNSIPNDSLSLKPSRPRTNITNKCGFKVAQYHAYNNYSVPPKGNSNSIGWPILSKAIQMLGNITSTSFTIAPH